MQGEDKQSEDGPCKDSTTWPNPSSPNIDPTCSCKPNNKIFDRQWGRIQKQSEKGGDRADLRRISKEQTDMAKKSFRPLPSPVNTQCTPSSRSEKMRQSRYRYLILIVLFNQKKCQTKWRGEGEGKLAQCESEIYSSINCVKI